MSQDQRESGYTNCGHKEGAGVRVYDDPDSDSSKETRYISRKTPSVTTFFAPGPIRNPPPKPVIVKEAKSCLGLTGGKYTEYIDRTETRSMGGVSVELRTRLVRQLFPYKEFPALKSKDTASSIRPVRTSVPANGNDCIPSAEWTRAEHQKADKALGGFARWEVDFGKKTVRSTRCEGLTTNDDNICDACAKTGKDESLVHAINRVIPSVCPICE
ncbi:hypothetical protein B0H14DRAFT_3675785 [Mycena olivaceomarginata]|nr:hypothetical protein B0H14DRAFT_3675785 [Mycena olivaceomarginata]